MITKIGLFTVLAGICVALFSGISQFFETHTFWVELTVSNIIGQENSETVVLLTDIAAVQNVCDFIIYDLPFFGFLLGVGFILLLISLFICLKKALNDNTDIEAIRGAYSHKLAFSNSLSSTPCKFTFKFLLKFFCCFNNFFQKKMVNGGEVVKIDIIIRRFFFINKSSDLSKKS